MCFNSRTHAGCDARVSMRLARLVTFQFTHPRGVRHFCKPKDIRERVFQFTHPRGVRLTCEFQHDIYILFQFTHPRGVRPYFGSRLAFKSEVSIHAPTRGATCGNSIQVSWIMCFNSRTHAGCDRRYKIRAEATRVSIHAPTRGATC